MGSKMSFQHFISTPAKQEICLRCQKNIWKAVVDGFTFKLNTTALDTAKEILLRLEGRRIFQTYRTDGGFGLAKRSAWHITKGDPTAKVFAEHSCDDDDLGVIVEPYPTPEQKEPNF